MPSRNRAREAAKAAADDSASGRTKAGGRKSKGKRKGKKKDRARKNGGRGGTARAPGSTGKAGQPAAATSKRPRTGPMLDPSAADDAETRFVQPYEATKSYICPGCNGDIAPGVGHLVAVPPEHPDLRRHWHRGCWHNRHTRF